MTQIQAIATEYSHTLFRSKTEAIFARALDLSGIWWEYEPSSWKHKSGWVPDFKMAVRHYGSTGKWLIATWCVELKPSPPTDAYYERLEKLFSDLGEKDYEPVKALIIGNPFDNTVPRTIEILDRYGWETLDGKVNERIFGFWDEAMKYRFDLQH